METATMLHEALPHTKSGSVTMMPVLQLSIWDVSIDIPELYSSLVWTCLLRQANYLPVNSQDHVLTGSRL